jgi:hypothetical protein
MIIPEVSSDVMSIVTTYASTVGIAAIMLQDQGRGLLEPVYYWARKLNPAERSNTYYAYDVYVYWPNAKHLSIGGVTFKVALGSLS